MDSLGETICLKKITQFVSWQFFWISLCDFFWISWQKIQDFPQQYFSKLCFFKLCFFKLYLFKLYLFKLYLFKLHLFKLYLLKCTQFTHLQSFAIFSTLSNHFHFHPLFGLCCYQNSQFFVISSTRKSIPFHPGKFRPRLKM